MLNKNDPLIGAVQEVMKRNQFEREAAKLVNEKFGVTDRKAMPHERLGEWDAAYKTVLTEGVEALDEAKIDHPNKKKLDVAEPYGELTSDDFKKLRAMKEATFPGAPSVKMPMKTSKHEKMYNDHHRELKSLADSGKINTPEGKKQASGLIDRIQGLVDKHLPGSPVPSKKIWLGEEGDPSKAIRGDVVTGGSSVTTVKSTPKPTSIKPSDQAALKKKILSIKEENLEEKAVSKAQQRFMGLVDAIKRGKAHGSAKAEKAAETMSAKEVKKYARTKHKGLPEKVDEAADAASSNAPQVKGQTQYGRYKGVYGSMQAHADAARAPVPSGAAAGSAMGSFKPAASSNDAKIKPFGSSGVGPSPFPKYDPNAAKNAGYAGDTRSKSSPERIANPSFVPRPSPGASALAKKAPTPGGARPSVVAKNTATGSQTSTGAQIGGARPSVVAKNTATAPAVRANDTGRAGVPGAGNRLAKPATAPAAAPKAAAPAAAPKAAAPAAAPKAAAPAAPKPLKTAGASTRDATLMGRAQAGGGQKLSTTFKSGGDRLAYFAARNRANK
jgi:hypothetical protein